MNIQNERAKSYFIHYWHLEMVHVFFEYDCLAQNYLPEYLRGGSTRIGGVSSSHINILKTKESCSSGGGG